MKLEDVLEKADEVSLADHHTIISLDGMIAVDPDSTCFRLFRNPNNPRSYLLVKKADVAGDIYEWTAEEKSRAGIVGAKNVHRVPLRFGTKLQQVSIVVYRLGERVVAITPARKFRILAHTNPMRQRGL